MRSGKRLIVFIVVVIAAVLLWVVFNRPVNKEPMQTILKSSVTITSAAFKENESIPSQYTCDGKNISPPLSITGMPMEAKTVTLIMEDPDAPGGMWDHWVMFNIPAQSESLQSVPEGQSPRGVDGKNSWGTVGYGGPCPPNGSHRYYFKVYALDIELPLSPGASKKDIEREMEGHVLSYGELMGRYQRMR